MSEQDAWRDGENAPRVERPIGRVNVDDCVAAVPHTPHRTKGRVGSRGPTLVVTNTPLRSYRTYRLPKWLARLGTCGKALLLTLKDTVTFADMHRFLS
jgi:hypothetical protein